MSNVVDGFLLGRSSARGRVVIDGDSVIAYVEDSHGEVVWGDDTGVGGHGRVLASTDAMVAAVRLVENAGQRLVPLEQIRREARAWFDDHPGTL